MKVPEPRKLPSGSWFVRVMVKGKSINITKPTKKECIAEAMAIKAGIKKQATAPCDITLKEAYKRHIAKNEAIWSPSTIAGYTRLSNNTFQDLMEYQLKNIDSDMIQREINHMKRQKKSPKYISNAVGFLKSILKVYAPSMDLDLTLPQKRKPDLRMLDDDEIKKVLQTAQGDPVELPVLMALWMGMRLSEIRGAKFKDIKNGRLHICRAIVDDKDGDPQEKGTKTYSGDRWIDLPDYISGLIPEGSPDDYIVKLSGQAIYKRFSRLLEKAEVEHCRFHDLRRANAAAMIRLGIDSKYAQQRNGWSTDYMYKQVYAYTMPDRMTEVNDAVNNYFCNKICNENKIPLEPQSES